MLSLANEKEEKKRKEKEKKSDKTLLGGRKGREGASRIIRAVSPVRLGQRFQTGNMRHSSFFLCLQLGTAGCSRERTEGARCSTCPG